MDIGIVYSNQDPQQLKARDFVRRYIREKGVMATLSESVRKVDSPTLIINGRALADQRRKPRSAKSQMFPGLKEIAEALERHAWCL